MLLKFVYTLRNYVHTVNYPHSFHFPHGLSHWGKLKSAQLDMRPRVQQQPRNVLRRSRNVRYRENLRNEYDDILLRLRALQHNGVSLSPLHDDSISRLRRLGTLLNFRHSTVENIINDLLHTEGNEVRIMLIGKHFIDVLMNDFQLHSITGFHYNFDE